MRLRFFSFHPHLNLTETAPQKSSSEAGPSQAQTAVVIACWPALNVFTRTASLFFLEIQTVESETKGHRMGEMVRVHTVDYYCN